MLAGPCRGVDGALGRRKGGGRPRLAEGALLKPRGREDGWRPAQPGLHRGGESLGGRPLEGRMGPARGPAQPPPPRLTPVSPGPGRVRGREAAQGNGPAPRKLGCSRDKQAGSPADVGELVPMATAQPGACTQARAGKARWQLPLRGHAPSTPHPTQTVLLGRTFPVTRRPGWAQPSRLPGQEPQPLWSGGAGGNRPTASSSCAPSLPRRSAT